MSLRYEHACMRCGRRWRDWPALTACDDCPQHRPRLTVSFNGSEAAARADRIADAARRRKAQQEGVT